MIKTGELAFTGQIKFGIKRFDLPVFYFDIAERHSTDTQYEQVYNSLIFSFIFLASLR